MATTLDRFADQKPGWDSPVMIESHQNGVRTKTMNPNTPVTYDEIVEDAIRCWDAGATAIHVHNSDFDLRGKAAADDYMPAWSRIMAERPDMIWYPTTCNNLLCTEGQTGLEHIPFLNRDANVQVAVVDTGIDMFAVDEDERGHIIGRPYGWDYRQVAGQVDFCMANKIAMIWGVYEPGHLRVARHYVDRGLFTPGSNWDFYLVGKYGLTSTKPIGTCGMEPTLESLYYYLDMIAQAKHVLPWFISIWGEGSLDTRPIIRRAIELGGHIKTGLELFYDPDRNPTNLDLLREVQEIAREVGRPLATHADARRLYNIT
ncbi:3-keto-5-aminohexanoate cleavage protein [Lichenihabitans sp. Uapishka_5]|uniref:3-keto-5-aminohexanoate cleavage protein n=1 Tax=Lichenihabitans sp. Uapishka_5 TaxID=3037302 RepID=UPI0029E80179|nr:3-keto-5-aminohexanoate cleavage protein [Lichenihabitans sp. Uapishka_5]MDX7950300.1 3-keto-5-aminohexanoate cleavage protein [Lichenihabitans sp. Uapishka_5]